jgi:pimeloyl-ACP methyl ester carboxylesterase
MSCYVLIPGPWMGAWVWEAVTCGLRRLGHQVVPVTLSGLDTPDSDVSAIGLDTHVDDVLGAVKLTERDRVVVVGHSYSGIVAGLVADRAPDRVAHTVYVEGFLPHHGRSMLHAFPHRQRALELRMIDENGGRWPVPDRTVVAEGQDLSPRQARWLTERLVGHPGRTLSDRAALSRSLAHQRATYVVCEKEHFAGGLAADVAAMRGSPNWTFRTIDTGHWPMVSAPDRLVSVLSAVDPGNG